MIRAFFKTLYLFQSFLSQSCLRSSVIDFHLFMIYLIRLLIYSIINLLFIWFMHQCTQLYIFIHLLFMKFIHSITYLFSHFLFIWFLHCSLSLHSLSFIKIFYSRNQSSKPNCISFSGTDTSAVRYEQPVELFNVQRCLPILDNWIFDKVCWAFSRFPRALFPPTWSMNVAHLFEILRIH